MLKHTVAEHTLVNGSRGLLIDIPDASVFQIRICFRAGDHYQNDESKWETAHIMEHLMLGANNNFASQKEFKSELEKNGAWDNASTQHIDMVYEGGCADFEWHDFLQLFIGSIDNPIFKQSEFIAECGNVRQELLSRSNEPTIRLSEAMARAHGFSVKFEKERIKLLENVHFKDIGDHFKHTHFPANMRFIIAGNLSKKTTAIIKIMNKKTFGGSKAKTELPIPYEKAHSILQPIYIPDRSQSNVTFALNFYKNRPLSDKEIQSLGLVDHILSGSLYSRILGRARNKGLIYGLDSGRFRTHSLGSLWFGSQLSQDNLTDFLSILTEEIQACRSGSISDKELSSAKQYALGSYQFEGQTAADICDGYLSLYAFDGRIDTYFTKFPEQLANITNNDVTEALNIMYEDHIWGIGFLGTVSEKVRKNAYDQLSTLWK